MKIFKSPSETEQNKKMAKMLIEQWSRLVCGLKISYKDLSREDGSFPNISK